MFEALLQISEAMPVSFRKKTARAKTEIALEFLRARM